MMLTLLLALLLLPLSVQAQAIDCADANATSAHVTSSGTTYSVSYTTPSPCPNCVTVIGGGRRGGSTVSITGATLGASSASAATSGSGDGNAYGRLFIVVNPPSGTNTAQITYGGDTPSSRHITVATCKHVDQSSPIRNSNQASGSGTGPTVTVSSVDATDVVVDLLVSDDGADPSSGVGAHQTVIAGTAGVSATSNAAMSRQSGADGGVMSWTIASNPWTVNAISLRQAQSDSGGDIIWLP